MIKALALVASFGIIDYGVLGKNVPSGIGWVFFEGSRNQRFENLYVKDINAFDNVTKSDISSLLTKCSEIGSEGALEFDGYVTAGRNCRQTFDLSRQSRPTRVYIDNLSDVRLKDIVVKSHSVRGRVSCVSHLTCKPRPNSIDAVNFDCLNVYIDYLQMQMRPHLSLADFTGVKEHSPSVFEGPINHNHGSKGQNNHEPLGSGVFHEEGLWDQPPPIVGWMIILAFLAIGAWLGTLAWICLKQETNN